MYMAYIIASRNRPARYWRGWFILSLPWADGRHSTYPPKLTEHVGTAGWNVLLWEKMEIWVLRPLKLRTIQLFVQQLIWIDHWVTTKNSPLLILCEGIFLSESGKHFHVMTLSWCNGRVMCNYCNCLRLAITLQFSKDMCGRLYKIYTHVHSVHQCCKM